MSEPLAYEFQMTPEFARAAAPELEQALWMQNERLYHHWEARMSYRPVLRKVGIVLAAIGTAPALLLWLGSRCRNGFFGGMFAIYAALLIVFIYLPAIGRALRRLTRRMVAWNARRTMERVARRAPYTIKYELGDKALATNAEKLKFSNVLELTQVRAAVETPNFVCAFAHARRQKLLRVLYVPGRREHDALCTALAANGAEIRQVGTA